jgi:hypothetical protein
MDSNLLNQLEVGREEFPADTGNIKGTAAWQPAGSSSRGHKSAMWK